MRTNIIQDVVDRRLTTQMAAQRLDISDRQCRRLLSRYRESGPLGMANRRRGKPSNNQLPDGLAQYALSIIRERYTDFGPTLVYYVDKRRCAECRTGSGSSVKMQRDCPCR